MQQNRWLLKRYRSYVDEVTDGGYAELINDVRSAQGLERLLSAT